jgi:ATP-dependent DNA helicase RecG
MIDLRELSYNESEQIEWTENVADIDDVVETLSAFANDLPNLGGGHVICGAREVKDEHGFPKLERSGLTAARLHEVEGTVLTRCRTRVSPPITPLVEQVDEGTPPDRRILVFTQPATADAHSFRRGEGSPRYFVRAGRHTIEARNGLMRALMVRKNAREPWDRRPCAAATIEDLDLLVIRDTLHRMRMSSLENRVERYLSADQQLNALVPSFCVREPLTRVLRPRNFAVLLFGREPQRFVSGAFTTFSIYPGLDRSDRHAERYDLLGNVLEQWRQLIQLLDVQSFTAFDKDDLVAPNALKYPQRALYEAMANALAHRDYEAFEPARVTVFLDRIEFRSPGSLPLGVKVREFQEGRAGPSWRNQALAWFFRSLQMAQAEGQGIPTIIRTMGQEGCPPPRFTVDDAQVVCILPAHPRHALLSDLRRAEAALSLGEIGSAQQQVQEILRRDPLNSRTLQLFAEVQTALHDSAPVAIFVKEHLDKLPGLPPAVLVQLAEAITAHGQLRAADRDLAQRLLTSAARGRLEERELRRIAVAMLRASDHQGALALLERQFGEHSELAQNASFRRLRGDALLGLAKRCRSTANNRALSHETRQRARRELREYLDRAEHELRAAQELSVDPGLSDLVQRNLNYLKLLRHQAQPRRATALPKGRNGSRRNNGKR